MSYKLISQIYLEPNALIFYQLSFQFVLKERSFHSSPKLHATCNVTFLKFVVKNLSLINETIKYWHYL